MTRVFRVSSLRQRDLVIGSNEYTKQRKGQVMAATVSILGSASSFLLESQHLYTLSLFMDNGAHKNFC